MTFSSYLKKQIGLSGNQLLAMKLKAADINAITRLYLDYKHEHFVELEQATELLLAIRDKED